MRFPTGLHNHVESTCREREARKRQRQADTDWETETSVGDLIHDDSPRPITHTRSLSCPANAPLDHLGPGDGRWEYTEAGPRLRAALDATKHSWGTADRLTVSQHKTTCQVSRVWTENNRTQKDTWANLKTRDALITLSPCQYSYQAPIQFNYLHWTGRA